MEWPCVNFIHVLCDESQVNEIKYQQPDSGEARKARRLELTSWCEIYWRNISFTEPCEIQPTGGIVSSLAGSLALTCHNTPYTVCVCVCVSVSHFSTTWRVLVWRPWVLKSMGPLWWEREKRSNNKKKSPEQIRSFSTGRNEASWTLRFFHSLPLTSAARAR